MKFSVYFVCLLFAFSCGTHSEETAEQSNKIHVSKTLNSFKTSEWFKNIVIQELFSPSPKKLTITNTVKLIRNSGMYALLGRNPQNILSVYNDNLGLLFSINETILYDLFKSKIEISDFDVYDGKVYVLLKFPSKIISFSNDGKILSEINLDFRASRFKILESKRIIFHKTFDANDKEPTDFFNHILVTDVEGKFLSGFERFVIPTGSRVYMDVEEPFGVDVNKNVTYSQTFNDTIQKFDFNGNREHSVVLGLMKDMVTTGKNNSIEDIFTLISDPKNDKAFGISHFRESKSYLSFKYGYKTRTAMYFMNKLKNENVGTFSLFDDLRKGYLPLPLYEDEEHFYGIIDDTSLEYLPIDEKSVSPYYQDIYKSVINGEKTYIYTINK